MNDKKEQFPKAIDAQRDIVQLEGIGQVAYYSDTAQSGVPLLLLHSINAAPSAMEVLPLFEGYRDVRPVYALDLPGFGASDRPDIEYSTLFFVKAIDRFIRDVIGEECDVIALSLTSEFISRCVVEYQTPFRSLCMISPTGFAEKDAPGSEKAANFLRRSKLASPLFDLLTSKLSVRFFLGKWFNGSPPSNLIDYAVTTAKHPHARFAPASFVSGKLFDSDAMQNLYLKLTVPVLVLYDRDPHWTFEKLSKLERDRTNWHIFRIADTMGMPHWTHEKETFDSLKRFWSTLTANATITAQE